MFHSSQKYCYLCCSSKNKFYQKTTKKWAERKLPFYNEKGIQEMNIEWLESQLENEGNHTVRGFVFRKKTGYQTLGFETDKQLVRLES